MNKVVQRITDVGSYYRLSTSQHEEGPFTVQDEQHRECDDEIARKLGVEVKEILLARLHEITRPTNFDECSQALGSTIRQDVANKLIMLSAGVLTSTDQDQVNVLLSGESAGGKSYTALEVMSYFPADILRIMATASPKAFYHDHGTWDKERKLLVVDLKQKILVFLDQPHYMLLEALRPLLSHDRRELLYKITDKNKRGQNQTKNVLLVGYPTAVFCAAKFGLDEQERTRMFMLSPETSREKLLESIRLRISRDADRAAFNNWIESHPRRRWLKARIEAIRDANITEIVVPNQEKIYDRFIQAHGHLAPRHTRDISRILALIKSHALLNWAHRETPSAGTILANQEDIEAGFWLYGLIAKSNELGVAPQVYDIWQNCIKPLLDQTPTGINRRSILTAYHAYTGRLMSDQKLRKEILPALEAAGLMIEEPDPLDRRQKLVLRPTLEDARLEGAPQTLPLYLNSKEIVATSRGPPQEAIPQTTAPQVAEVPQVADQDSTSGGNDGSHDSNDDLDHSGLQTDVLEHYRNVHWPQLEDYAEDYAQANDVAKDEAMELFTRAVQAGVMAKAKDGLFSLLLNQDPLSKRLRVGSNSPTGDSD